jgi:hypothetical protein
MSAYIEFKTFQDFPAEIDGNQEILKSGELQGFSGRTAFSLIEKILQSGGSVEIINGDGEIEEGIYKNFPIEKVNTQNVLMFENKKTFMLYSLKKILENRNVILRQINSHGEYKDVELTLKEFRENYIPFISEFVFTCYHETMKK